MITDAGVELTVTPGAATLFVDDTLHLSASLHDRDGVSVAASKSWSVDNPAVATVDTMGTVRGVSAGSAMVRVTAKGAEATASLVVVADSGQTLSIAPNAATLFPTNTQQFSVVLKDRNGNALPANAQWKTDNTAVATVDANGFVRAVGIGSATLQAQVRNLIAAATIKVAPQPPAVVLVGAGDIASCATNADEATAKLLDALPTATVFTAGDNAYENGSPTDFTNCYGPTWGRHKSRTHPTIGNHEYNTPAAAGYFGYFGSAAGDPTKGYYSYDLGAWHIIVLNSNIALSAGSAQESWLRADLAAHSARCTLAMWHHPRFSSGQHGSSNTTQPLWQALYDAGADLVVVGHDHIYERFAPQTPEGQVDNARGLREFVVGTGGADLYQFDHPAANSEAKNNTTHGVLKLTLFGDHYEWKFLPVAGSSYTDSGSGACH